MKIITPVKVNVEPEVKLTLDMTTAQLLRRVLQHVGGPPRGHRGRFDALDSALESAGVTGGDWDAFLLTGCVKFQD
jgi:hypothetical protein